MLVRCGRGEDVKSDRNCGALGGARTHQPLRRAEDGTNSPRLRTILASPALSALRSNILSLVHRRHRLGPADTPFQQYLRVHGKQCSESLPASVPRAVSFPQSRSMLRSMGVRTDLQQLRSEAAVTLGPGARKACPQTAPRAEIATYLTYQPQLQCKQPDSVRKWRHSPGYCASMNQRTNGGYLCHSLVGLHERRRSARRTANRDQRPHGCGLKEAAPSHDHPALLLKNRLSR